MYNRIIEDEEEKSVNQNSHNSLNSKDEKFLFTMKQEIISEYVYAKVGDYPLHYHDHFEMEIVYNGQGSQIFNGQQFKLKEKDIFLLRPLDYHQIHSNDITFHHIKVKENMIPKWALKRAHSFRNPVVYHLTDKEFKIMNNLFDLLADEVKDTYDNLLETSTLIIELIFTYFFRLDKNQLLSSSLNLAENFIMKVTYYLQHNNHFTDKITLDEIAAYTGYSKYYTSSLFHKYYGMTIQDYVVNLRIEYAKKLIISTNHPMTEIILESGFTSTSNFYQKFTKMVGVSPLKFKAMSKDNIKESEKGEEQILLTENEKN